MVTFASLMDDGDHHSQWTPVGFPSSMQAFYPLPISNAGHFSFLLQDGASTLCALHPVFSSDTRLASDVWNSSFYSVLLRVNAFCFVFDICLVVDYKDSLWCVRSSWKLYSFIIKVSDRYWVNFCKAACGSCRFPVIIGFWWFHGCLPQVDISLSIC